MIKSTLELLKLAREKNWKGNSIDIALGSKKIPQSFKEMKEKLKRK